MKSCPVIWTQFQCSDMGICLTFSPQEGAALKMKMLFLLCCRNQETGKTQENALSKLRVVIITVEFSSCAAGVGYKGGRHNFNLPLLWKTDVAKMNSECRTNATDLHLPGIVWSSPKAVGVTGFVSFIFCQFIIVMWIWGRKEVAVVLFAFL